MIKIVARGLTDGPPSAGWFKSSFSASNSYCVEVRFDDAVVRIRDTKDHGQGPIITVTAGAWIAFLDELTN